MKILIEESVLRQALEALIDFNQQSIGGIALPAEIDTAMDALRETLDTAEKVEDQLATVTKERDELHEYIARHQDMWRKQMIELAVYHAKDGKLGTATKEK